MWNLTVEDCLDRVQTQHNNENIFNSFRKVDFSYPRNVIFVDPLRAISNFYNKRLQRATIATIAMDSNKKSGNMVIVLLIKN